MSACRHPYELEPTYAVVELANNCKHLCWCIEACEYLPQKLSVDRVVNFPPQKLSFPLLTPNPPQGCVYCGCDFALAFLVLAPGTNACTETDVDIDVLHCVHGQSNELRLRETAESLGVELSGKLRPCASWFRVKGYACRKSIPNNTTPRAT